MVEGCTNELNPSLHPPPPWPEQTCGAQQRHAQQCVPHRGGVGGDDFSSLQERMRQQAQRVSLQGQNETTGTESGLRCMRADSGFLPTSAGQQHTLAPQNQGSPAQRECAPPSPRAHPPPLPPPQRLPAARPRCRPPAAGRRQRPCPACTARRGSSCRAAGRRLGGALWLLVELN